MENFDRVMLCVVTCALALFICLGFDLLRVVALACWKIRKEQEKWKKK